MTTHQMVGTANVGPGKRLVVNYPACLLRITSDTGDIRGWWIASNPINIAQQLFAKGDVMLATTIRDHKWNKPGLTAVMERNGERFIMLLAAAVGSIEALEAPPRSEMQ